MKKKFIMLFAAAAMIVSALPLQGITAGAEELYTMDNALIGPSFSSFEKLAAFAEEHRGEASISFFDDGISDFILSADGIYLPESVPKENITGIFITNNYCCAVFDRGGTRMEMSYFFNANEGRAKLEEMQYRIENKLFSASKVTAEGKTVYYCEMSFLDGNESFYVWKQDGNYFELRINGSMSGSYLSLCSAKKIPFEGASESGGLTKKNGKIYFIMPDGSYAKGWQKINRDDYYFRSSGEAVTKSADIDGIRYGFGLDGVCSGRFTGYVRSKGISVYYLDGIMQKGFLKMGSDIHYFDEKTGAHVTGEKEICGKTYNFSESGVWDGKCDYSAAKAYTSLEKKLSGDDAGMIYLEGGAIVTVWVKNRENAESIINEMRKNYAPIVIKDTKFSKNELEEVKDHLNAHRKEYLIQDLWTSKENRVECTVRERNEKVYAYYSSLPDRDIIYPEYGSVGEMDEYMFSHSGESLLAVKDKTAICKSSLTGYKGSTKKIRAAQFLEKKSGSKWKTVSGGSWSEESEGYDISVTNSKENIKKGTYRLRTVFTVYGEKEAESFEVISKEVKVK